MNKLKPFYCKPASREEEFEIAERLLANGVGFEGWISADERLNTIKAEPGFCLIGVDPMGNLNRCEEHYDFIGASELSIQQVRERYPLPDEVKQEFVPEVGKSYMFFKSPEYNWDEDTTMDKWNDGDELEVVSVRKNVIGEDVPIVWNKITLTGSSINPVLLKPIKTEAEIKRQEQIEYLFQDIYEIDTSDMRYLAEKIHDKGYIKPIEVTDGQIDKFTQEFDGDLDLYSFEIGARWAEKHIKGEE